MKINFKTSSRDVREADATEPSVSEFISPVILVTQKCGARRFCIDMRRLNSVIKTYIYHLPRIHDSLDTLGAKKLVYLSNVDMLSGFHQMELEEGSKDKTVFTTHNQLYQFKRSPFELKNNPACFQRLLDLVLREHITHCCLLYIDDVIIFFLDWPGHLRDIAKILVFFVNLISN